MTMPTEIYALVHFCIQMIEYIIPCLLGSAVSYYIKSKATSGRKKHPPVRKVIGTAFAGTIIPCVIMMVVDHIFANKGLNDDLLMALSVLLGAIGEDITRFFLNIKNILVLLKTISKGVDEFKDIAEVIEKLEEHDEENKDKKD